MSLTSVSREFQWNFKEVGRVVQRCFKGVLRHFQGSCCFRKFWSVLQGRLKSVFSLNQGYFKEVSKVVQSSFNGALRVLQGNLKELIEYFKCFNDVS